ncbi:MAG: hydroxyacid dehydrogenase [Anaerolineae bacterium]
MTQLLHVAQKEPSDRIWIDAFCDELRKIGDFVILENGEAMSEEELASHIRACDILLTGWGSARVPLSIAEDPGSLGYVCNITGTMVKFVPVEIIDAGIPVTNWGDAPAGRVAENAVTLTLAMVKGLRERIRIIREGGWHPPEEGFYSGLIDGLRLGVYGYGFIGRRYVEMLRPFRPVVRIFDPYIEEIPEWCERADSLEELFEQSEVVAIHAGLTEETRGSITAEILAKLPDQGVLINTARGAIVDQDALFVELEKGRLRAGLDVLDPDWLPPDHAARSWDNLILTAHDLSKYRPRGGFPPKHLIAMHRVCLENLQRYLEGEPLRFVMDRERYLRST